MAPTNPALTQHAVPVQLTNDSAIVSKHSSESKGYIPTNQYISHVVAKPAKRSPLINRGYYLRMKLLDTIVQRFLEECSDRKERPQIINIGCGYDPTAFRILSESSVNTPLFIDIDFPELANRKTDIIISDQKLSSIIFPFTSPHYENAARISFPPDLPPKVAQAQAERFRTYTEGVRINSQNYKLIGCDLSQGEKLRRILDTVGLDWEKPILVLSEVVLTYVPRHIADIVISFFGKNCKNGLFIMYEQHIPTFPSIHGFTHTMLQHFDKLNSSLKCVSTYPTMRHAVNRFLSLQWSRAEAMDLHTYWNQYVDCLEHDRVADLELFDEFEEISLKFGGYFVAVAGNGDIWDNVGYLEARRTATLGAGYLNHADPTISGNPHLYPRAERHDLVFLDEVHLPHLEVRSHSSAIIDDDVIIFGGFGSPFQSQYTQVAHSFPNHTRQYTTIVYNLKTKSHNTVKPCTSPKAHENYPPALQFHTLTPSSASRCVYLFGGRTNPSKSFNDTYVFHMDSKTWEMVATSGPTPSPRFRHSAVLASLNGKEYLIVHGGRDATTVFDDLWALDLQAKIWISLVTHYDNQTDALPPRFAFEMAYVAERNSLFVYGGLQDRAGAKAVPGLHQIRIAVASDSSVATTIKAVPTSLSFVNSLPVRFGCKMVTFPMNPHKLIVVGGISGASEGSFVPFDRAWIELDISSMTWRYLNAETPVDKPYIVGKHRNYDNEDGGTEEGVEDIEKVIRTKLNPLMLFNMSVDVWGQNSIVVTGGGGTCFSFGSRFDPGIRVWKSHIDADDRRVFGSSMVQRKESEESVFTPPFEELRRMEVNSEEEWLSIYNERTPVVMSNVNFGDALTGWDSGYLKRQVGDKKISVHVTEVSQMDYHEKNFNFQFMQFDEFIDRVFLPSATQTEPVKKYYLRSLSDRPTKTPANIRTDFPSLASDVSIPSFLKRTVEPNLHSVPLRISSAQTSLWTHYDIHDNILVQVHGTKSLLLFPPTPENIDALYIHDSSSHIADPNAIDLSKFPLAKQLKSYKVTLKKGDALFIPALWFHHVKNEDVCVGLNLFWKGFEDEWYSLGRDLYGNKDLCCFDEGVKAIGKWICKGVQKENRVKVLEIVLKMDQEGRMECDDGIWKNIALEIDGEENDFIQCTKKIWKKWFTPVRKTERLFYWRKMVNEYGRLCDM